MYVMPPIFCSGAAVSVLEEVGWSVTGGAVAAVVAVVTLLSASFSDSHSISDKSSV